MKVFEFNDGELHFYAAKSKERAIKIYTKTNNNKFVVREVPNDELISVINIDEEYCPISTKTAREWAKKEGCFSIVYSCARI